MRRASVLGLRPKTLMPAEFTAQPLAALLLYGCGVPLAGVSAEQIKSKGPQRGYGPVGSGRQGALGAPDPSGGAVQVIDHQKDPRATARGSFYSAL